MDTPEIKELRKKSSHGTRKPEQPELEEVQRAQVANRKMLILLLRRPLYSKPLQKNAQRNTRSARGLRQRPRMP
jgi:hypothetical protein